MARYRSLDSYSLDWLSRVVIEDVKQGRNHPSPGAQNIHIYLGTSFQLYSFAKERRLGVDCVMIDEAGQMGLGIAALTLRWLKEKSKIVVAGDHLQLGTIFSGSYPTTRPPLFGSILDFLAQPASDSPGNSQQIEPTQSTLGSNFNDAVIQITENFRLQP